MSQLFCLALATGYAATDRFVAQLHDFSLYSILFKSIGNLRECHERITFLIGTSV